MRLRVSDLELLELARWSADNFTASLCLTKGQQPVSNRLLLLLLVLLKPGFHYPS